MESETEIAAIVPADNADNDIDIEMNEVDDTLVFEPDEVKIAFDEETMDKFASDLKILLSSYPQGILVSEIIQKYEKHFDRKLELNCDIPFEPTVIEHVCNVPGFSLVENSDGVETLTYVAIVQNGVKGFNVNGQNDKSVEDGKDGRICGRRRKRSKRGVENDLENCEGVSHLNGISHVDMGCDEVILTDDSENSGSSVEFCSSSSSSPFLTPNLSFMNGLSSCTPKKSNLRKLSAYETPRDSSFEATPKRRIRIVVESDESSENSEEVKVEEPIEVKIKSHVYSTMTSEEMHWISGDPLPVSSFNLSRSSMLDNRLLLPKQAKSPLHAEIKFYAYMHDFIQNKIVIKVTPNDNQELESLRYQLYTCPYPGSTRLARLDGILQCRILDSNRDLFYYGDICFENETNGFKDYVFWKSKEVDTTMVGMGLSVTSDIHSVADVEKKIGKLFCDSTKLKTETVNRKPFNFELFGDNASFNICNNENIPHQFVEFVLSKSENNGLHLLTADLARQFGPWDIMKEVRYKRSLFSQCLLALECLRTGGDFICTILETFTVFTVGIVFLMYRCFESVCIHDQEGLDKASGIRFLICKNKRENEETVLVRKYLKECYPSIMDANEPRRKMMRLRGRLKRKEFVLEIREIVPLKEIFSHSDFFEYIRSANKRHVNKFVRDVNEQYDIRMILDTEMYRDIKKQALISMNTGSRQNGLQSELPNFQNNEDNDQNLSSEQIPLVFETELTMDIAEKVLTNCNDWVVFPVESGTYLGSKRGLFQGSGESIFWKHENTWTKVLFHTFELGNGSVVYGELLEQVDTCGRFSTAFYVYDAFSLGKNNIQSYNYEERRKLCYNYIKILNKCYPKTCVQVAVRDPVPLKDFDCLLQSSLKRPVMGFTEDQLVFPVSHNNDGNQLETLCNKLMFWKIGVNGDTNQNFSLSANSVITTNVNCNWISDYVKKMRVEEPEDVME